MIEKIEYNQHTKKYTKPKMKVVDFLFEDIITQSECAERNTCDKGYEQVSMYNNVICSNADYSLDIYSSQSTEDLY